MNHREALRKTRLFVRSHLSGEATGHDYWHTVRVVRMAERIARNELADLFVVRLAALLQEIS